MIPTNQYDEEDILENDFELENEPSLTYRMNTEKQTFVGKVDDTKAIEQAILKILNTERYEHEIYSWDYGIELKSLIGQPIDYVMSEVKVRITEALSADDRIEVVEDFVVEKVDKHTVHCSFKVITTENDRIYMEKEVDV